MKPPRFLTRCGGVIDPALPYRRLSMPFALVRPLKPSLKSRHGILQLPLAIAGLQFPRLFKNGLDVVVIAVVRPCPVIGLSVAAEDVNQLISRRSRQTITGNLPLFTFTSNLHLVRVSARARSWRDAKASRYCFFTLCFNSKGGAGGFSLFHFPFLSSGFHAC